MPSLVRVEDHLNDFPVPGDDVMRRHARTRVQKVRDSTIHIAAGRIVHDHTANTLTIAAGAIRALDEFGYDRLGRSFARARGRRYRDRGLSVVVPTSGDFREQALRFA